MPPQRRLCWTGEMTTICKVRAMRQMQTAKGVRKLLFRSLANQDNVAYRAKKVMSASGEAFILVPSFASLLSGEASVLILHFSLAAFL